MFQENRPLLKKGSLLGSCWLQVRELREKTSYKLLRGEELQMEFLLNSVGSSPKAHR